MPFTPVPQVDWLQDWRRVVEPQLQREYVRDELARLAAAGAPVLTQVLAAPLEAQQLLALSVLHADTPLPSDYRFYLRLVEPATGDDGPPLKDPQGRDLPPAERGRVLVAKTTTLGGRLNGSARLPPSVTQAYSAQAQQHAQARGRDIYAYVRIGRDPVALALDDALCVLRKWGHGLAPLEFLNRSGPTRSEWERMSPKERSELRSGPRQSCWLVEELPPAMAEELLRRPPPAAPRGKPAPSASP